MARKPRSRRGSPPRRARGSSRTAAPKRAPKKSASTAGQTAYQRRIARAMAQGKTLQEARGHRAKEHISRRERELREGQTTYQRGAIKKFAIKQARRADRDEEEAIAHLQRWAKRRGWDAFVELREDVRKLSRVKRVRVRRRKADKVIVVSPQIVERARQQRARMGARMEALARRFGLDFEWFFYH